ncbi:Leucine-, isoleucine-, valine-, threonine-, and alanine-binding protein precursor (plasmid) [Variovorax sp. SRS16]|uniref:amino acid ABC transporter substrate-binding protein n=1 Tax=Variovorax sp. SRS16 TaxID=282217 RepID=UPI0013182507|nr:amino acid ABC transporter substrate-binding protein [Variovorax sp. SRS16]VTU46697.1 Leucine-, isoleucine-, valine-, threonine-, and alanine-binding protein precursor [Variovorax sp. SRS16]
MDTLKRRFLAALTGLALCAGSACWAQAEKPVRIGFSIAKTGIFANAAPSQLNSYELWKDTVNAAGGLEIGGKGKRQIEFVMYDDQSNPGQAARIYEKLITQDKVDLLLAPWGTPTHAAVAPVLERFKFPMIGNSAASTKLRDLKPGYIWFVTAAFPDRVAKELAVMLKSNGVKSVALLTNVLPYSKELKNFLEPALKEQQINVVVNVEYPPDIKDMTVQLSQVKQAHPDAILSLSYPGDSPLYARQAKELGLDAKFQFLMVGPGMDFFPKLLGSSVNGVVTMGHWAPSLNARSMDFYRAYSKKFNENPDYLDSAEAYVSCEILQQAVAKAGLDKAALHDAISTGTFDTIFGAIKFTGVENQSTKTGFLQLQNGVPQLVWPRSVAGNAQFQPKVGW